MSDFSTGIKRVSFFNAYSKLKSSALVCSDVGRQGYHFKVFLLGVQFSFPDCLYSRKKPGDRSDRLQKREFSSQWVFESTIINRCRSPGSENTK